jgi:phospholipid transport system substrate-binding protein
MIMRLKPLALASFFLLAYAGTAPADPGTARETVETGAQTVLDMLRDPSFRDPATRAAQRTKIEDEVLLLFDFEEFSTRTVGPSWRTFTPDQKSRFQAAFTDLLRNSYIDTLDSYNGENVEFTGEIRSDNDTRAEIRMNLLGSGKTYPVAFRLLVKHDRWVVYDVIIEGISMIRNYRDQFRDILAGGDAENLISRVEAKAREQLEQRGTPAGR